MSNPRVSLDQDVIRLLRDDARLTAKDIAGMLGVAEKSVAACISHLEKDGVILKYTTVTNDPKGNKGTKIRALIELSIRPEKKTGYDAIARRICKHPNVVDHFLISGNYDFLVIVEGDSLQEISSFVSDKLASIENVRSTATHFILKKYKEHGVVFDAELPPQRLAVSP